MKLPTDLHQPKRFGLWLTFAEQAIQNMYEELRVVGISRMTIETPHKYAVF